MDYHVLIFGFAIGVAAAVFVSNAPTHAKVWAVVGCVFGAISVFLNSLI